MHSMILSFLALVLCTEASTNSIKLFSYNFRTTFILYLDLQTSKRLLKKLRDSLKALNSGMDSVMKSLEEYIEDKNNI